MEFSTLLFALFLLFFMAKIVVNQRWHKLDLAFLALLGLFFVEFDSEFLSSFMKFSYLVFFFLYGVRARIPSSMIIFFVAYIGLYVVGLVGFKFSLSMAIAFLVAMLPLVLFMLRGRVFFDVKEKKFKKIGNGGNLLIFLASIEHVIFRAIPVILVFYGLMPLWKARI